MIKKTKKLIGFNKKYHKYPNSVSRGYWARYPVEIRLNSDEKKDRARWLDEVERLSQTEFYKFISKNFHNSFSEKPFFSLLVNHGIFIEKFFKLSIRELVTNKYNVLKI
ncbi:MAG: hypothetical protein MUC94_05940, partial [bacterium]|nr:hypothetical protein [bacterium]